MQITIEHMGRKYRADLDKGRDLSSVFGAKGEELKAWGSADVRRDPVRQSSWIGSVKSGASVHFYNILLNPHGNGTHTECYGHILAAAVSVKEQITHFSFI